MLAVTPVVKFYATCPSFSKVPVTYQARKLEKRLWWCFSTEIILLLNLYENIGQVPLKYYACNRRKGSKEHLKMYLSRPGKWPGLLRNGSQAGFEPSVTFLVIYLLGKREERKKKKKKLVRWTNFTWANRPLGSKSMVLFPRTAKGIAATRPTCSGFAQTIIQKTWSPGLSLMTFG